MGILARLEQRNLNNPNVPLSKAIDDWAAFYGWDTKSGTKINETTALNLSAVWAAVRVLTDTVASTPVHVYQRLEPRGKQRAPTHPIYRLLHDRANPEMSAFTFFETLQGHVTTWGNGYAEKERNGRGEVIALWPIPPNRVAPKWVRLGAKIVKTFEVDVEGVKKYLSVDQVMHVPGFGYDGLVGYSAIHMARESLGLTKAAEEFGGRMFGQGLRASGVLSHPQRLNDAARDNLRKSIEKYNTGLENAHRLLLLEEGLTFTANQIPPEDAQFLETRKFQTVEIARWFKVPPHKIGDLERATFSNIEHQSIEFATDTARPWFVRWEQVLNWELFSAGDRGTYFAEFLMDALLRGDTAARGAFYSQQFQIGAMSQNEIRERENLNPIEGGDRTYIQGALVPVDKIDEIVESKKSAPAPEAPKPAGDAARYVAARDRMLRDAAERVVRREVNEARRALKKSFATKNGDGDALFRGWMHEFYQEQARHVEELVLPVAEAFGGIDAAAFARGWVSQSRTDLLGALLGDDNEARLTALLDVWESERAAGVFDELPVWRAA